MKQTLLLIAVFFLGLQLSDAQKYAYVDTEYILKNIPEYEAAQKQLDELSEGYQKEIEALREQIEKMYNEYQSEKALLIENQRREREDAIIAKEKETKELQMKYFGREGELYKKRQELVKPIQDKVFNAIKDIAEDGHYALVFDVSGSGLSILYTDPKYDKSEDVLQKLGYK